MKLLRQKVSFIHSNIKISNYLDYFYRATLAISTLSMALLTTPQNIQQQKLALEYRLRQSDVTIAALHQSLAEIKKQPSNKTLRVMAISAAESLEVEQHLRKQLLSQYITLTSQPGRA